MVIRNNPVLRFVRKKAVINGKTIVSSMVAVGNDSATTFQVGIVSGRLTLVEQESGNTW
jgi:hypothetical protein